MNTFGGLRFDGSGALKETSTAWREGLHLAEVGKSRLGDALTA